MILLAIAFPACAETSQFLFDPNGNLTVQMGATLFPPQIIGQPQNQVVAANELAAFSVIVADPRSLTYQWRFNNANLGGATNAALLLENVSASDEGEYSVVLTNPSCSATSAPALLLLDQDADGMADSWERSHFSGLAQTATGDADGDGVSNLQEFLDGTDPSDPNSTRYRLLVIRDGGSVVKTFDQVSYTNGESVTLTAIASPGGEPFHAWLGDIVTRSNPVTLVMTNNKTVFARFTPIDFLWTKATSGDWEAATNWTPNLAPGLNDNVVITNSLTVTLNTAADCAQVILSGTSGPILTGSGSLTVRAAFLWTAGTMSGSGRTIVESNATFTFTSPFGVTLSGRTLENGGTVLGTGAGSLALQSGAVITNRPGGIIEIQSAGGIVSGSASNRIDNAGSFRKLPSPGTLIIPATVAFNNSGTVEIQAGTLRFAGGGSASGAINAAAATLLEWSGGTFTLNSGAQLNGSGLYQLNGGNVNADGTLTVESLDVVSGSSTLGGTGVLTIAGVMNWTAGTLSGTGRTIIAPGATLNAAVPSQVNLARTLENGGTVLWTNGIIALNNSVITNRSGALFHAQGAGTISIIVGSPRFDNAGTFRKSTSTGTITVPSGISLNNFGTMEIQSGALVINGGFTNHGVVTLSAGTTNRLVNGGVSDGTFTAAATALVEWTGGTFTLNPGALLNGAGLYRLNGGNVTLAADLTVENLDLFSAFSTLAGSGAVTIASAMNWTAGTISGTGRMIIAPGATLNAAVPSQVNLARTLENGGTVNWTGNGTFGLSGVAITNRAGALFHAQNAAGFQVFSGLNRIDNAGTFRKSTSTGITAIQSGISFNNSGAVEIQLGTLVLNGGFTNHGAVNLSSGTTNRLAGGGVSDGTFTAAATALVESIGGTFTLNPGALLDGAGLYRLNGGSFVADSNLTVENLDLVSAFSTLAGSGAVTIASRLNWTAGIMIGSGKTIIQPGAMLNLAVTNAVALNNRTLENAGTVLWIGPGLVQISSAVITNRAGALFEAQNAAAFVASGLDRFDNAGTFRKSVSTGTTTIGSGVTFNNSGTVDIRSGILFANGGYTSSSNALLNCALGGTTPGTGHGQLQVAGTVTLNGVLSVDLSNGFPPALNDSFTVLTAGTRNGTFFNFLYPSNAVTMQLSNTANSVIVRVNNIVAPAPLLFPPVLSSSNVLVSWTAVSNKTYRLEFNPNLGLTNWDAVPGDVTTLSNTASRLDALTSSNRFYRVRVIP